MSNVPSELRYLKSHEWARLEADGTITIGISDHAQQALGDLVFAEVPEAGRRVSAGEACAVVESVNHPLGTGNASAPGTRSESTVDRQALEPRGRIPQQRGDSHPQRPGRCWLSPTSGSARACRHPRRA